MSSSDQAGSGGPVERSTESAGAIPPGHIIPGQEVGRYRLLQEIAHGGLGRVYRAVHLDLQQTCAIKFLIKGAEASAVDIERFRREARTLGGLNHPNLVRVFDFGVWEGHHYLVMDLVQGETLASYLEREKVAPRRALEILRGIASGVACAHRLSIVHRDLKPGNVMLTPEGQPLVLDFGLAKDLKGEERLTESGELIGTPWNMAPEQVRGEQDKVVARTDVYALGTILYEMLTGRPPFDSSSLTRILMSVLNDEPVPPRRLLSRLHPEIETICLTCMAKEPARRYADASALVADIDHYLAGEPISARPASLAYRLGKKLRKHGRAAALVAATGLAAAGVIVHSVWLRPYLRLREHEERDLARYRARQAADRALAEGARAELARLAEDAKGSRDPKGLRNRILAWIRRHTAESARLQLPLARCYQLLASVEARLGKPEGELEALAHAYRLEPDTPVGLEALRRVAGRVFDRHDYSRAEALYLKLAERDRTPAGRGEAQMLLGDCAARTNRLAEAWEWYQKARKSGGAGLAREMEARLEWAGRFAGTIEVPADLLGGIVAAEAAIGDFDRDGKPDLVLASRRGEIAVFSLAGPTFERRYLGRLHALQPVHSMRMVLADLDGDGGPELAVLRGDPRQNVADLTVYGWDRQAGAPRQAWRDPWVGGQRGSVALDLAAGDVDGDGRPDLLAGMGWYGRASAVYLARGRDRLEKVAPPGLSPGHGVRQFDVADWDGDERNEVLAAHDQAGGVGIFRRDGASWRLLARAATGDVGWAAFVGPRQALLHQTHQYTQRRGGGAIEGEGFHWLAPGGELLKSAGFQATRWSLDETARYALWMDRRRHLVHFLGWNYHHDMPLGVSGAPERGTWFVRFDHLRGSQLLCAGDLDGDGRDELVYRHGGRVHVAGLRSAPPVAAPRRGPGVPDAIPAEGATEKSLLVARDLLQMGAGDAAVGLLRGLLAGHAGSPAPVRARIWLELAQLFRDTGRLDEAEREARALAAGHPTFEREALALQLELALDRWRFADALQAARSLQLVLPVGSAGYQAAQRTRQWLERWEARRDLLAARLPRFRDCWPNNAPSRLRRQSANHWRVQVNQSGRHGAGIPIRLQGDLFELVCKLRFHREGWDTRLALGVCQSLTYRYADFHGACFLHYPAAGEAGATAHIFQLTYPGATGWQATFRPFADGRWYELRLVYLGPLGQVRLQVLDDRRKVVMDMTRRAEHPLAHGDYWLALIGLDQEADAQAVTAAEIKDLRLLAPPGEALFRDAELAERDPLFVAAGFASAGAWKEALALASASPPRPGDPAANVLLRWLVEGAARAGLGSRPPPGEPATPLARLLKERPDEVLALVADLFPTLDDAALDRLKALLREQGLGAAPHTPIAGLLRSSRPADWVRAWLLVGQPGTAEPLHDVYRRLGDPDRALRSLSKLGAQAPDPSLLGVRLEILWDAGRHAEVLALARAQLALDPGNAELKLVEGMALLKTGDAAGALRVLESLESRTQDSRLRRALASHLRTARHLTAKGTQ